MRLSTPPCRRMRSAAGLLAATLFTLMAVNQSPGQSQPGTVGQPIAPAAGCAALLPEVDPAGPAQAVAKVRRRRALLVGISKYAELGTKSGMWKSLPTGCDVELMRQVLKARFAFQDSEILTLTEGQATKLEIDKAFREHLIKGAGRGDVVVFYFSGHGQPVPDEDAFGGLRGSMVTANYTTGTGPAGYRDNVRSDEVRELLRTLKDKMKGNDGKVEGNITVLFDSCYSGGATKGDLQEKGRPWDPAIDGPIPQPKPDLGNKGEVGAKGFGAFDRDAAIAEGYVFISACRNYQVAYCPQRGTEASIFTYHLARRLAVARPETTYRDLFEPLSAAITSGQIPQLEGDSTKLLLAGAALPNDSYLVVQAVDGNRVTLPVGFVQGITGGTRYALYRAGTKVRVKENQLGEAKVVTVDTSSCVAELDRPLFEGIKPEHLKAARAVELERAFGANPLYVLFEGVKRPEAELKKYAIIASVDEEGRPVTKKTYHVRVRLAGTLDPASNKEVLVDPKTGKDVLAPADGDPKPRKGMIWVQTNNGDVLDEFPADNDVEKTFDVEKAIVEALFNEWKSRYLAEYLKARGGPEPGHQRQTVRGRRDGRKGRPDGRVSDQVDPQRRQHRRDDAAARRRPDPDLGAERIDHPSLRDGHPDRP